MTIFQALVLGVVQGLTELLPISSSGHLIIVPALFGWAQHSLAFDTTLHLGTAFALLLYFWRDLWRIARDLVRDIFKSNWRNFSDNSMIGIYILVGSIPTGLAGFLFGDFLEQTFRHVFYVVIFLAFGTLLMVFAEKMAKIKFINLGAVGIKNGFIVGLFQVLALLPGVSRSGATISGGMFRGLGRADAAKFSFLLSIPIVLLAGFYKALSLPSQTGFGSLNILVIGFVSSFISGLVAVFLLMKLLQRYTLKPFIIYRVLLIIVLGIFLGTNFF